jgi:alpha-galactosidase
MLDRHASSLLSLDEIAALVDELIDAHGDALPEDVRGSGTRTAR